MKRLLKKIIPQFAVNWYHRFFALVAPIVYGYPSKKMIVIGVTGTNGKSTVVNLISKVLEGAGHKVGFTTTTNFKVGDREWLNDTKMTMLGRFKLQKLLKDMVQAGCRYAIIETSSEGIRQYRHMGIVYDAAVFTNLTPEHIESHGSFENYKKAKLKLFSKVSRRKKKIIDGQEIPRVIVVNGDDEHALDFANFDTDRLLSFAINNDASVKAENVEIYKEISFAVDRQQFNLQLMGEFNVYNALAAISVGKVFAIEREVIKNALEKVSGIPGRMEKIEEGQPYQIIVDYAPEPASMEALYKVVDTMQKNKVIHVFGSAGGGRDTSRRPVLGQMVGEKADIAIVTNEDPYDEDPQQIINQVAAGAKEKGKVEGENLFLILDRREAITKALSLSGEGDLVLITGKGSEQAIVGKNNKKTPWDDRKVTKEILSTLSSQT